MKPIHIVLTINLTLFLVIGLFFWFIVNRPELIPLFTGFQALFNLLGMGGFYLDRKRDIMIAFLIGTLLTAGVTIAGFVLVNKYKHLVGVEEMYTS